MIDLFYLARLCRTASPLPWKLEGSSYDEDGNEYLVPHGLCDSSGKCIWSSGSGEYAYPDSTTAELIVTAINQLPSLLEEVQTLRKSLAESKRELARERRHGRVERDEYFAEIERLHARIEKIAAAHVESLRLAQAAARQEGADKVRVELVRDERGNKEEVLLELDDLMALGFWDLLLHTLADYLAERGRDQPGLDDETRGRYYSAAAEVRVTAAKIEMLKETP